MARADETKGKIKETTGRVTGDRKLEREGKADRAGGKAKDAVDKVKDALTGRNKPRR